MSSLRALLNPESPAHSLNCMSPINGKGKSPITTPSSTASRGSSPDMQNIDPAISRPESSSHPPHENCPDSLNCLPDTDGRPQHTLPIILRCAILGSAKQRLTIRDIYAAMENKYSYYKTAGPAWKQSVRHHLSLNRLFERQAKPVTEPGFGSYWTVNLDAPPGTKRPRKRGRQTKNTVAAPCDLQPTRRGRPKKCASDGFEYEPSLGIPPITTMSIPATTYSSQQYRLHAVPHLPPVHGQDEDDEVFDALDSQEQFMDGRSLITSDDADETDDETPEEHASWAPNFDPRMYPPSPPRTFVDSNVTSGTGDFVSDAGRLQEEVRELRRQAVLSSTLTARMASDLNNAHAEISRLRIRNELLERSMSDVGHRMT
ncbi:hypothetical protein DFH11DRAFT_1739312 [Phellopilus nigrolimitatus]|nr:hypothetical protein DFH11DRAFT_1739312 [Phellopilus nigrolimitatus]